MSIFLTYFDDGPLDELSGRRASVELTPATANIMLRGKPIARRVVVISDGVASDVLRHPSDATGIAMWRDVSLLVAERFLNGYTPRLLFHVFRGALDEETIDVVQEIELTLMDLFVRVTRVQAHGRSGSQRSGGAPIMPAPPAHVEQVGAAEGDVGPLSTILQKAPYDALVALTGAPRTQPDRGGRRKKSR